MLRCTRLGLEVWGDMYTLPNTSSKIKILSLR